jgi:hypothetical protein
VPTPGLIRSGWWVAVTAVVVSALVVVAWLLAPGRAHPVSNVDAIAFEPTLVDRSDIVPAMARDGLKALDRPGMLTPAEVEHANETEHGKLLVPDDLVVGVSLDGEVRAYPMRLLRWHEVVNDVVGGRAVAVTSCPLAGSVAVWDRRCGERTLELAVSGMLLDSTALLYDRHGNGEPASLWHQLSGEAVTGPAVGSRLSPLPAELATWGEWRDAHPDTSVMAPDPASNPLYRRDPYHAYRGSDVLRFPVDPLPPTGPLALKDRVAVVTVNGIDTAFALSDLALAVGSQRGVWAAALQGEVMMVRFDAITGAMAVTPHDPAMPAPPVRYAYWFAWYALHPGTATYP